jgi:hypothetical protein
MIRDVSRRMSTQCLAPDGTPSSPYGLGSSFRCHGSLKSDYTAVQRVSAADAAGSQIDLEAVHGEQRPGGIPLTQRR